MLNFRRCRVRVFLYCSAHASPLENRSTDVPSSVRRALSRRGRVCAVSGGPSLAGGLRLPLLRHLQRLALEAQARDLGMCRLRTPDLGHSRDGDARQPSAAPDMVSRGAHHDQPFQRHVGAATSGTARAGQLQDGVVSVAEAASRHGRPGPQPSDRPRGNRRNGDAVPVAARS